MMQDREILETLQKAVAAAVAASTLKTLQVKYSGRTFTPPDNQKYLECVFIPNNRTGDFWGEEKNYQGLFRMILHWPNDDLGFYPPMDVLASVAGWFSKGKYLAGLQITASPDFGSAIENGAETLYPCGMRYAAFRP